MKSEPTNASRTAPRILGGRYLVGLTWRHLIDEGDLFSLARLRAIEERAVWYAHDGDHPIVGLVCQASADITRQCRGRHALAVVAARAFPAGRIFLALQADAGWWIATLSNGMPDGLDAWVDSVEQVQLHFQQALQRGGFDAVRADPALGFADSTPWVLSQFESFESPASRMRTVRRQLPRWLAAIALTLLAAWGASIGLAHWRGHRPPMETMSLSVVEVDAAWQRAFQAWRLSTARPSTADLSVLRQAVHAMPTDVGGWAFESLDCGWQNTGWSCTAHYRRPDGLARRATNRSFEAARPRTWTLAWTSATQVRASFTAGSDTSGPFDPARAMPTLSEFQIGIFSDLQELGQLFAHAEVSGAQRLEIPVASNADGRPLPRPSPGTVPEVFRAALTLTGPLRNLEVIEQAGIPVRWRELSVTHSALDQAALRLSAFTMTLKGEIHARQS